MMDFIFKIIKQFGIRRAIELAIKIVKWIASQTNSETDDAIVARLEELYNLLYPLIPVKSRK